MGGRNDKILSRQVTILVGHGVRGKIGRRQLGENNVDAISRVQIYSAGNRELENTLVEESVNGIPLLLVL
jgi:hypothetical protein